MYTKQDRKRRGKKAQLSIHVNKLTREKGMYVYRMRRMYMYGDEKSNGKRNPIHSIGLR